MVYNDNFEFPPVEPLVVEGLVFDMVYNPELFPLKPQRDVFDIVYHPEHAPLRLRREEFGLSQQQVATAAGITLRQYQRFESGERKMSSATMRIGLSICWVLKLDPYRFVCTPTSD